MSGVAVDIIIFIGAVVCIAFGGLVISTRNAIKTDLQPLVGGSSQGSNSLTKDITNYIIYSYNGAIACLIIGSVQILALFFKYTAGSSFKGGRR